MQRPPANAALVKRFNQKLDRIIGSDLPILQKIKKFVIKSGGKRIRPITHFYFTAMLGYTGREWEDCGAIGELIHAASLLHDDVVDEASMRRGKPSINALEGNKTAVLSGDYLLACGLDHLGTLPHAKGLLPVFTRVIRMLAIGELLQMQHEHNLDLKARDYNRIILGKTGSLFGAMTESAWIVATEAEDGGNARMERRKAYRDFGERMGYLFQVRDDYLDYFGDAVRERKDIYQDFRRGL
ncbi:MAG: polyprenyl synthetase family protein, partial [Leptospiraceae bacterium]|nr:polyprenyl synthetase family protein [Leptospiraceae bacterium]